MRLSTHVHMSNYQIDNLPNQFDSGNFLIWEQPTIKGNYVTFSYVFIIIQIFSENMYAQEKRLLIMWGIPNNLVSQEDYL